MGSVEEKFNLFLEELENKGIEITGETAFICDDGVVLFYPNDHGAVDIIVVRNPIKIDYKLGITDAEVDLWKVASDIMGELGG